MIAVVMYSKPGCCLCDAAREYLTGLQHQKAFSLAEINILEDPEAYSKFKDHIPVVFVNGAEVFRHHVDENKMSELLR